MIKITDFTEEEIKYICAAIPYQEAIRYFKKYPKEFTKIKPGFRVKALNEQMVKNIFYEFRNKDFISSFLCKHIEFWIKDIEENLLDKKEKGFEENAAYIDVLSRSFFDKNIGLFFKITDRNKTDEYISILSSAVKYVSEQYKKIDEELMIKKKKMEESVSKQQELERLFSDEKRTILNLKKREQELNEQLEQGSLSIQEQYDEYIKADQQCKQLQEKIDSLDNKLKSVKEDEVWKTAEMQQKIDLLTERVIEQTKQVEESCITIKKLEDDLASRDEEVETWKKQVRNREKQIFEYKAEQASLLMDIEKGKKQIKELKESVKQTAVSKVVSEINIENEHNIPVRPENMEEFDEYFRYNLEDIGFDLFEDEAIGFLDYIEQIIFEGVPLIIKRGPGINIANALSNTLYGVPVASRLLYKNGSNAQTIKDFLEKTPHRVVCIDGFIGNCNILELFPILEQYRNKIIILTYMFDRTLNFIPCEILSYAHFISADMYSALLKVKDIKKEPSEIKELIHPIRGVNEIDSRLQKIFKNIACECGIEESTASTMASIIKDENVLNEMLLFTLLPYVQKVLMESPYNCSKHLQHYAGEKGRCIVKDIMMRWFG